METSNQPFAACTEIEAIGVGAGAGTLGSTPARWLVAFTADTMRVSVSYRYGSRSLIGASWEIVSVVQTTTIYRWDNQPIQVDLTNQYGLIYLAAEAAPYVRGVPR